MVDPAALDPEGIARREFTTTFRGFDQVEVRAFLSTVAIGVREILDRERELVREVEQTEQRAIEVDQLDEHRLTALLGEETARIFEAAREAATEIRGKAEAKTAQLVREAQDDANRMTSEAAEVLRLRTAEAETAAASIVSDAEAERDRILADATAEAEALRVDATGDAERMRAEAQQIRDQAEIDGAAAVEAGRQQGREMVAEAQVVRERILKDLARRRRTGKAQLEQLRAARERLLDAYALVRRTLEEATSELTVAVPEAKLAAEAAGRRVEMDDDELSVEAIEAELDAGRVAGVPLLDTGEHPVVEVAQEIDLSEPVAASEVGHEADDEAGDEAPFDHEVDDPQPVIDADDEGAAEDADGEDGGNVEDLFARIRSEVPAIDANLDQDDADDAEVEGVDAEVDAEAEGDEVVGSEDEFDEDEAMLERRDRHLIGLEANLARVLKRQLADDENDKLDLIRRMPAKSSIVEVLPALDEHRQGYVDAVTATLVLAAASGNEFAASILDGDASGDVIIDLDIDLDDLATELADSLLAPIRDRIIEVASDADGDDALDGVRACYKRWKGSVTDLAAQYVHTAFNRGVYDATPDGNPVLWVVDPGAGPCPDGEDNTLAGPITKGTAFPTGHLHPPAHPDCRCLLVPGVL
jgi:DivIVA domain-containing protein